MPPPDIENTKGQTQCDRRGQPSSPNRSESSLTAAVAASISVAAAAESGAATARYAAIVVDAKTGKTLYSQSADEPRFPASLTKMMTLYLIFEALAAGQSA